MKLSAFNGYDVAFNFCISLNLVNDQQCRNEFLEYLRLQLQLLKVLKNRTGYLCNYCTNVFFKKK